MYGASIIEVTPSTHGYIGQQIDYFIDETNELDFQEVVALEKQGLFLNSTSQIIVHSSPLPMYWFSFQLHASLTESVWLNINNSNLNEVELYRTTLSGEIVDHYHTGNVFPDTTRAFDSYTFWFPLVEAGDTTTYQYFVKLKASLNMLAPFEVGSLDQLKKTQHQTDVFVIFFLGVMSIMFLYNLVLFLFTKDRVYGYYSFYVIATTFVVTFLNNFPIIEHVIGANLAYNYTACWFWTSLVGMGLFTIHYLQLPHHFPKINKLFWIQMGSIMAYGVLNFFIPVEFLSFSYQILVFIFFITCIITAYYVLWKSKSNRAILYSVGWTIMILGATSHLLVINGILNYTPITRNLQYSGVAMEVFIFSIALARRLNELKAEQESLNAVLKATNLSLKQSNDALDSFNYHVSHDLKTVLYNSNALARMIEKYNKLGNQKKVHEIVEKLMLATENGAETVQSFLSLGKVDSILQKESKQILVLTEILDKVLVRNHLGKLISVLVVKNEIRTIKMHEKALESVLLNLFTNTIKYNTNKPEAKISFFKKQSTCIIIYQDNGVGIDLEKYGKYLFQPFQRATSDQKSEGTGVGLYLIKRIIDNYNGEISVDSVPNHGTTFTIQLPLT